jgi:hypothetical protein
MAGRGPAPAETRRRRNPPARGDWVDLPQLERTVLPDLPALAEGEWSMQTRVTWAAWQRDPVTVMYTPADVAYALDTIRLYDVMTPSSASEVRLRMDSLGLTPKGKRDLRWRVLGTPEFAPDAPAPTPHRDGSRSADRRARLRAVK